MGIRSSLKVRLAVSIGLLAMVASVLVSLFASQLSRTQIERDQSALLRNFAVRMSTRLTHDMSARASELLFLAAHDRIRDPAVSAERKQAILERVRASYPFYAWIGITDTKGNVVAGTDGLLVGKSVAGRAWFAYGLEGLHFGDAHDAFLLARLLPKPKWDDLPLRLVDIAAPLRDEAGALVGVICGHLSLDWAFEARESMLDQLSQEELDLVVLNRDGRLLMGTPQLPSLKVDLASLKAVQGLDGQPYQVSVETWPDGRTYLTAAVRERGFRHYPGMGWTVVARKLEQAAFAPAERLSRIIRLGGLITALLFAAILWAVLDRQLRPLERISAAARRMRETGVPVRIPPPQGEGEVAEFARSLTLLVDSLQAKNEELRLTGRVFEESGQGIVVTDAANRIVRINRAFTRITGYEPEDVLSRNPSLLQSGRQSHSFYQSMWAAIRRQGAWQGEIWNRTKSGHVYPEWLTVNTLKDDAGVVTNYIGISDDITEKKEYEKRIVHLANYDALTNLPNRNLLQAQVAALVEPLADEGREMALVFVDLDKFKHINDTLGHPAGDLVLKEVAARFAGQIGKDDLLARWGGDEFVVVVPRTDRDAVAALARRLIDSLHLPFPIEGRRYHLGMSAGIAMFPADGDTVDHLLRCADTAMYRAKKEGSNLYRFYEGTMNIGVERFLRIDNALRQALDNDAAGLSLVYQPQFDPDGTTIIGAEALLRWSHSDLGDIDPSQFIPVAEDSGLIVPLGRWIIDRAVRDCARAAAAGCGQLSVSINCSARQLQDANLAWMLYAACTANGVSPSRLVVEVTESAIMSDEQKVLKTVEALKSLGYRISLDDFGTGYSCLNYIQKIRPVEVKIDQGFVGRMHADPNSRNIIVFTVALATSLGMGVGAEGVETEEQRRALREIGPIRLQGFLLGRPMPLEALIARYLEVSRR